MSENGNSLKGSQWLLLAVIALLVVALAIDLADGHHAETAGTAGLALGMMGLYGERRNGHSLWRLLAIVGFVTFIGTVSYRMAVHQGWIAG